MSQHPNLSDLQIRNFVEEDFVEYQQWFQSETVKKFLGSPPDPSWLEHVLNDKNGVQLSVLKQQQLVAVVGVHFATTEHPTQVITDIAVIPEMARTGLGSLALSLVLSQFNLDPGIRWQSFIEPDNSAAIAFFKKNDWQQTQSIDENGMLTFQLMN